MKKRVLAIVLILIIVVIAGTTHLIYCIQSKKRKQQEFLVYQSYSHVGGGYDDTQLFVIVYVKNYDAEQMCLKVRDSHDLINGASDKLTINLYNSKKDFINHKKAYIKVFYKENEQLDNRQLVDEQ